MLVMLFFPYVIFFSAVDKRPPLLDFHILFFSLHYVDPYFAIHHDEFYKITKARSVSH